MEPSSKEASVVKFEDLLNVKSVDSTADNNSENVKRVSNVEVIPRGRPKSGKFWKSQKQRASSMVKSRGLREAWEKKQQLRNDLKRVKEKSRQRKQELIDLKEAKKERRRQNLKRQEENRKKSEIVQVIKNPSKLKRMNKKQLRNIEKRDTTKMKPV